MNTSQRDDILIDSSKTISIAFSKLESIANDPNYLNSDSIQVRELFDAARVAFQAHMAFKGHLKQFTFDNP